MCGFSFECTPAWPKDLKALHSRRYRAVLLVKNLENYIKRVDPGEFDCIMEQLNAAKSEAQTASRLYFERRWQWESNNSVLKK